MKVITVSARTWDIKSMYQEAKTPARRALAGYIIKAGKTNDPIYGAAFTMLRGLEVCNGTQHIYDIDFKCSNEDKTQIIRIVEATRSGSLNSFSLSRREINHILSLL